MKRKQHLLSIVFLVVILTGYTSASAQSQKHFFSSKWQFKPVDEANWLPAKVPGTVHTDLLANKKIDDPFMHDNESKLQWIEKKDWEYKTTLTILPAQLKADHTELVFDGLDTYADIYLNDSLLGKADNMFLQWRFPTRKLLKAGNNSLRIVFNSPMRVPLEQYNKLGFKLPANNDAAEPKLSPFTRKAPYSYGWDWGPRFVTSGIWRPFYLQTWNNARLTATRFQVDDLSPEKANVTGEVSIYADKAGYGKVTLTIDNKPFIFQGSLSVGENQIPVKFEVNNPRYWWTNGLGKANLYPVKTDIAFNGKPIESKTEKIGLRTVRVVHEKDQAGKSFYVVLNGRPVFMKGANYIPSDNFLTRVTTEKYRKTIQDAVDANMNMLRVWGGGTYEDDRFYDICDEKGILLWHDFMFACTMYPTDTAFLGNVKREFHYNIQRLRNHPSIALWCGNNEIEQGWGDWGWYKYAKWSPADSIKLWQSYQNLFEKVLPSVLRKEDPSRFYTRSSPSTNEPNVKNNKKGWGDRHDWTVWFSRERYDYYKKSVSRFVSEYGFQSFPTMKTIEAFTSAEERDIETPVMKAHQKHDNGNAKIKRNMDYYYTPPKGFDNFVYVSGLMQAEAMKMAIEVHRRNMPYCMGTLYWQLNDCWPVVSWASVDYYNRWKPTQYFAKKANQQIMLSTSLDGDSISVYGVNDLLTNSKAVLLLRVMDFTGKVYEDKSITTDLKGNSSELLYYEPASKLFKNEDRTNTFLVAELIIDGQRLTKSLLFLKDYKDLKLPVPKIKISKITPVPEGFKLELTTDVFAKNVFVETKGFDAKFTDNYMDLLPNEPYEITIKPDNKLTPEQLKQGIGFKNLAATYQ